MARRLLLFLSLPFLLGSMQASPAAGMVQVGDDAPNFTRVDVGGMSHSLVAYRGRVVLLALVGYG